MNAAPIDRYADRRRTLSAYSRNGRKARLQVKRMKQIREKLMMTDKEVVDQLAMFLGIETEMGKEYLGQMIQNARLFEKKQRCYGSANYAEFGTAGAVMRIREKSARLKKLVFETRAGISVNNGTGDPLTDESVADSLDDIANIAVIGRLCHDGKWK